MYTPGTTNPSELCYCNYSLFLMSFYNLPFSSFYSIVCQMQIHFLRKVFFSKFKQFHCVKLTLNARYISRIISENLLIIVRSCVHVWYIIHPVKSALISSFLVNAGSLSKMV